MHLHRYIYSHIHLLFIYITYIFKHNIIIHTLYTTYLYIYIYIIWINIWLSYKPWWILWVSNPISTISICSKHTCKHKWFDQQNKTYIYIEIYVWINIYILSIGFVWYIFWIPHWMSKSMVKHCMEHVQETWPFIGSYVGQCHGMIWSMVGHKPNRPGMASIWSSPNKSRNGSLACCKPNSSDLLVAPHRWSSPEWQVALATMAHPGCRSTGQWYWWYHPGHWSWCLLPCCGLEPGHWPGVFHLWSFQACGQMGPLPYPLAFGSME